MSEEQEGARPKRPWWQTCGIGCLILFAALITLSVLVAIFAPKDSRTPAAPPGDREAEDVTEAIDPSLTVDFLDSHLSPTHGGDQTTDVQRKAYWRDHCAGRRVRWRGTVVEVTEMWGSYHVSLRCGSAALGSDTSFGTDPETAAALRKDQLIVVEGTLRDHTMLGYTLVDVVIVEQ